MNSCWDELAINGYVPTYAYCGENYTVIRSFAGGSEPILSHFRYSAPSGEWDTLMLNGDPYLAVFPDLPGVSIGKNFVVSYGTHLNVGNEDSLKVYSYAGTGLKPIEDTTYEPSQFTNFTVGDDYYAYFNNLGLGTPNVTIKTWNGKSFDTTNISPSGTGYSFTLTSLGNRLIVSWVDITNNRGMVSYTKFNPATRKWSPLLLIDSIPMSRWYEYAIDYRTYSQCIGQNEIETICYPIPITQQNQPIPIVIRGYEFRGDSVKFIFKTSIDNINLRDYLQTGNGWIFEDPSRWIIQPGNNFFAVSRPIQSSNVGLAGPDSVNIYSITESPDGSLQFKGNPTVPVLSQRIEVSGMGDSAKYTYSYQNGVMNEYMTTDYGKVTTAFPGNNGQTVTSYYTAKDSVSGGLNYKFLDGMAYKADEYNNGGTIVNESNKTWGLAGVDTINGVYFQRLDKDSLLTDNVPKTTSYSYDDYAHAFQLSQVTETNSDGTQRITCMKYPLDYNITGYIVDTMTNALNMMVKQFNDINQIINKWIIQKNGSTQNVVSSDLMMYYYPQSSSKILPLRHLSLRSGSPISLSIFIDSYCNSGMFYYDQNYYVDKTYVSYSPYAQPQDVIDANGIHTAVKWGYNYTEPVAQIQNAKYAESDFIDLENGWQDWATGGSTLVSTQSHTGVYSALCSNAYGPTKNFYAANGIDKTRSYTLDAWAMIVSGSGLITIELRDSLNNVIAAYSTTISSGIGWQHCSVTVTSQQMASLPSNGYLRVWCGFPNSSNQGYVDDIRFAPSNSLVTTATYDPATLMLTSKSGTDNNPTYYTYDSFQRLASEQNYAHSTLSNYSYYLAGSSMSSSNPSYTTVSQFRSGSDSTTTRSFTDGLGRLLETQVTEDQAGNNVISCTTYDSLGRVSKKYKPAEYTSNLGFKWGTLWNSSIVYYYNTNVYNGISDSYPFSVHDYYDSQRPKDLEPEGSAWQSGHRIQYAYGSNAASEDSGYSANTLNKTTTIDENGTRTLSYKDNFGNLVQTETDSSTSGLKLITSLSYDVLGNLVNSTPPKGSAYKSNYQYNTLSQLTQKTSSDADTVQYLYDKSGNLRFIKDANHKGAVNACNNGFSTSSSGSGSFTLTSPGYVNLELEILYYVSGAPVESLIVRANGVSIASIRNSSTTNYYTVQSTVALPKGSYTYSYSTKGGAVSYYVQILCQNTYEFVYSKYDSLNRVTETGEENTTSTLKFTQANADNPSFPSSYMLTKKYFYDNPSSNPIAAGQRNLKGRVSETDAYRLGALCDQTFYSYDQNGRVEWMIQNGFSTYAKKLYYTYDLRGNITQKEYYDFDANHPPLYTLYAYDKAGRLDSVRFNSSPGTNTEATYHYFASGKLKQLTLGNSPVATLAYNYNERDWLSKVFSTNFWEHLGYNTQAEIDSIHPVSLQWNGNISWQTYYMNVSGINFPTAGWTYSYDKANRFDTASFGILNYGTWEPITNYSMPKITYDANGNITVLQRNGSAGSLIDNLSYKYRPGTNIDTLITNSAGTNTAYTYDSNGNVASDSRDSLAFAIYDINNLPVSEYMLNGTVIQYGYDVNGQRMEKVKNNSTYTFYINGLNGDCEAISLAQSQDNVVYNILANGDKVSQVCWTYNNGNFAHYYYLKDHLGDVKMIVNSSGSVDSWNDYYPFGMQMDSRNGVTSADARYKYTSKERDVETGYDYFGARYYDSRMGRWLSVDPLAEKLPQVTPYNYTLNNPLRIVDPDGQGPWDIVKGAVNAIAASVSPTYKTTSIAAYSGDRHDYAVGNVVGDVVSMAIGGGEMFAGGTGAVGGVAADATGLGALVGVPATALGAAVVTVGVATTAVAMAHLSSDVNNLTETSSSTETQSFGDKIREIESNKGDWENISAHTEKATQKGARESGASVQEILENKKTGERVVRHTVTNNKGKVTDTHYRPNYKPRNGEVDSNGSQ